jgi:hypothetical protein
VVGRDLVINSQKLCIGSYGGQPCLLASDLQATAYDLCDLSCGSESPASGSSGGTSSGA